MAQIVGRTMELAQRGGPLEEVGELVEKTGDRTESAAESSLGPGLEMATLREWSSERDDPASTTDEGLLLCV